MGTGGSRGIRTSEDYVRRGGAVARMMLLQAAADQWNVPVSELTVSDGIITHAASNRKTSYGMVAAAAAKLTPPDPRSITLKDPRQWKVAGKSVKRLDTTPKLDGKPRHAIDVKLPNMLCASIKACPVFGGKLVSWDAAAVMKRRGVKVDGEGERLHGRRRRRHLVACELALGICRSCGTKAQAPTARARRSPRISPRDWPQRSVCLPQRRTRRRRKSAARSQGGGHVQPPFLAPRRWSR
jgi:hypothetical protein